VDDTLRGLAGGDGHLNVGDAGQLPEQWSGGGVEVVQPTGDGRHIGRNFLL
jgi:hypothetical protein